MEPGYIAQSYVYGDSDPRMEAFQLWMDNMHPDTAEELEAEYETDIEAGRISERVTFEDYVYDYWKELGNE